MRDLNVKVAEVVLGWKWVSYLGYPMGYSDRATPGGEPKVRVRTCLPATMLADGFWIEFLEQREGGPATGDEPLAEILIGDSSRGTTRSHDIPDFVRDRNALHQMELHILLDGYWDGYRCRVMNALREDADLLHRIRIAGVQFADPFIRCVQAVEHYSRIRDRVATAGRADREEASREFHDHFRSIGPMLRSATDHFIDQLLSTPMSGKEETQESLTDPQDAFTQATKPTTTEIVYRWPDGREEVRYRRSFGSKEALELVRQVRILQTTGPRPEDCPYFIRHV